MKIVLISLSTPTLYNVRAASALPYHLLKGLQEIENVETVIYSFNINELSSADQSAVEQELNTKIHIVKPPRWIKWMFRLKLSFLRVFMRYPVCAYYGIQEGLVQDISEFKPDCVWIYGEELSHIANKFGGLRRIVTMPDCESLYFYRLLSKPWVRNSFLGKVRALFGFTQYNRYEKDSNVADHNLTYHFVGKEDARFYKENNPFSQVVFLPHPLYEYNETRKIGFHHPLRVLFAGRYDLYCKHGADSLLQELETQSRTEGCNDILCKRVEVTFLGKGWDDWVSKLRKAGLGVRHINFVDDYISEICNHDIQVNTIDVGTGTKGKVLDAIANGLLEIGTKYSLENIDVSSPESCILYSEPQEFISTLMDIVNRPSLYEEKARLGMTQVRVTHDRCRIARALFKRGESSRNEE